ncbi:MAG: hypothetical protein ACK5L3_00580 [Oscillospiraceae bacterium]
MTNRINEESIVQQEKCCWLCGNENIYMLERHEAFYGTLYRQKSIDLQLTVLLCGNSCHRNGPMAVHQPGGAGNNLAIKQAAQQAAMDYYGWSVADFIREFGKNYLGCNIRFPSLPNERKLDIWPDENGF